MWRGVTDFLENVDKTAAANLSGVSEADHRAVMAVHSLNVSGDHEMPDHHHDDTPARGHRDGSDSVSFGLGDEEEEGRGSSHSGAGRPLTPPPAAPRPRQGLPPPPRESAVDSLQAHIRRLEAENERREEATRDRDKRYLALEADYDAVSARGRGLEVELQHRADEVAALKEELITLRTAQEEASSTRAAWAHERATLVEDLRRLEEAQLELTEQLDGVSAKLLSSERAKGRAEEALAAANAALTQYKSHTKMLLDAKAKRIAELEASQQGAPDGQPAGSVATVEDVLCRPDVAAAVDAIVAKTVALRCEAAEGKTLEANDELKRVRERQSTLSDSVSALQLHNHQLQEMLDEEKRAAEALSQRLQTALAKHEQELMDARRSTLTLVNGASAAAEGGSDSSLEAKVQEMASLVMQKQQALEEKRAEADQWRMRFEVSSQRLREAEMVSNAVKLGRGAEGEGRRSYAADYGGAEEGRPATSFRDTTLFSSIAARGRWGRKVAGAADRLDGFSLSTGSYLRKNSTIRLALIAYVILLQLYVFVVVSVNSVVQTGAVHEMNTNMLPNGRPLA